jgi:hypothetical protein
MTEFAIGDKILIQEDHAPADLYGVVFEVTAVNPKNIRASRIGGGRGINYPKTVLLHFEGETVPVPNAPLSKPYVPVQFFNVGEIVSFKEPAPRDIDPNTPYVVTKDAGDEKINVFKLGGGDGARYWRPNRNTVIRRDLEWLKGVL